MSRIKPQPRTSGDYQVAHNLWVPNPGYKMVQIEHNLLNNRGRLRTPCEVLG
jgi:hypothetical protein